MKISDLDKLNETVLKNEFLHPFKLGVNFNYIPNPYNTRGFYDEFSVYVDENDENVYMYVNNYFTFVYEIKSESK